jgi:cobalt/nickel transport system permease protein
MADITKALNLDELASRDSPIHNLDGRIKLISTVFIIVIAAFSNNIFIPIILEIFLLIVIKIANLSYIDSFKRIAMLLPFGGAIIIFQPFVHPGNVLWSYSWLTITDVGLNFAILLLVRIFVSLTSIVILSSTSPMQQIVASLRRLKMPKDLAMILSIMVRFLFVFIDELAAIRKSQKSRNFHIHSNLTPYKWRVRQVGYTVAMMFVKSYEQGERVYRSMVSRGFSDESDLYNEKKSLERNDYIYICTIIILVIVLEIILIKYTNHLGYFGENLSIN